MKNPFSKAALAHTTISLVPNIKMKILFQNHKIRNTAVQNYIDITIQFYSFELNSGQEQSARASAVMFRI
jgi:hypothetical protein